MTDDDAIRRLEERLGHDFTVRSHLIDALTHRSFKNERPDLAPRDNERMEFLGDAILDLAASALLFQHYPEAREGELSRRRADLVCERSLAAIGVDLGVGEALRLGRGEDKSGGREKPRLLASAVEALIASVYLDTGEQSAITISRGLLAPYVEAVAPGELDYKSRLQEHMQVGGGPPPTYEMTGSEGPDHDRTFFVEVRLDGRLLGSGRGRSKSEAEQDAARRALQLEEEEE